MHRSARHTARTVPVIYEHHVTLACVNALEAVADVGFSRLASHYIATSVSELANNLLFHATQGGTITLAPVWRDERAGIEIIAEDDGPGIGDIGLAMQGGYSTRGGIGEGLPAVSRLMDEFEIASTLGNGTRVVARMWIP